MVFAVETSSSVAETVIRARHPDGAWRDHLRLDYAQCHACHRLFHSPQPSGMGTPSKSTVLYRQLPRTLPAPRDRRCDRRFCGGSMRARARRTCYGWVPESPPTPRALLRPAAVAQLRRVPLFPAKRSWHPKRPPPRLPLRPHSHLRPPAVHEAGPVTPISPLDVRSLPARSRRGTRDQPPAYVFAKTAVARRSAHRLLREGLANVRARTRGRSRVCGIAHVASIVCIRDWEVRCLRGGSIQTSAMPRPAASPCRALRLVTAAPPTKLRRPVPPPTGEALFGDSEPRGNSRAAATAASWFEPRPSALHYDFRLGRGHGW